MNPDADMKSLALAAQALATSEQLERQNKQVVKSEDNLATRERELHAAQQEPQKCSTRLKELNAILSKQFSGWKNQHLDLLDDAIRDDAAIREGAQQAAALRAEQEFLNAAIQRLVIWHMQKARRDILVAQHAVAEARAEMLYQKALYSMAQRLILIGPLIAEEQALTLSGGKTETLSYACIDARVEANKLASVIRDFDVEWEQMLQTQN